jgi:hypothetical protein
MRTLLILAANPKGTERLRLDEEVKRIEQGLERSKKRDQFKLASISTVPSPTNILEAFPTNSCILDRQ